MRYKFINYARKYFFKARSAGFFARCFYFAKNIAVELLKKIRGPDENPKTSFKVHTACPPQKMSYH